MDFSYPAIMHSTIFEENNGALGLYASPSTTPRTRHIVLKYHFYREHVGEEKVIIFQHVISKYNKSDLFTIGLP